MAYNYDYRYTSQCPYLKCEHSICITYAEIPILGQMSPGYKKMSYGCDYFDECPYPEHDEYGRCPLFISAPDEPH